MAESRPGIVLVGSRAWDPAWSLEPPLVLEAPVATVAERHEMWLRSLNGARPIGFDPAIVTLAFRLAPGQIRRAAQAAHRASDAADRQMTVEDISAGARAQNAAGLERLAAGSSRSSAGTISSCRRSSTPSSTARRPAPGIARPSSTAGDGPAGPGPGHHGAVRGRLRHRQDDVGRGPANDLDFDHYDRPLSTVVDKYIGETEKNLDRIFTEADRVNGSSSSTRPTPCSESAARG